MLETVGTVIDALGGTGVVAEALALNPSTVSSWRKRRSIPVERWGDLRGLAEARGVAGVTLEGLALLHTKAPEPAEARA